MTPSLQDKVWQEFRRHKKRNASDLVRKFGVTRQALHRYLRELMRTGKILKQGTSRKNTFYLLNSPKVLKDTWKERKSFHKRYRNQGLQEDAIYREISSQPFLLSFLGERAESIFHYAFTEMVNNAIDHSRSRFLEIVVQVNAQEANFSVLDFGVGIFENIQSKKNLKNEMEALQDLMKGKQTTAPEYHSGEGIFFTSKAVDHLIIESHRKRLIVDNRLKDIFIEDVRYRKGTKVHGVVDCRSGKKLEAIFKEYTNEDYRFQKSRVTVKLFQEGEPYVSRSQAKRLLHSLDRFEEIVLDFKDVQTIGQGFADEIFRVFASQHPKKILVPIHCHENVHFMIERAKRGDSGLF